MTSKTSQGPVEGHILEALEQTWNVPHDAVNTLLVRLGT
jgi:hypothetical protein